MFVCVRGLDLSSWGKDAEDDIFNLWQKQNVQLKLQSVWVCVCECVCVCVCDLDSDVSVIFTVPCISVLAAVGFLSSLTTSYIQSVLDIAMPIAQTQFIDCLKKLAQKLKDEGKF